MAKDKRQEKPPKRKTLPPADRNDVCEGNNKVKRVKRETQEVEEAPVQLPEDTIAAEEKQENKAKQKTPEAKTTEEVPAPPNDPDEEEDLSPEERRVLERKMKKIRKKEEKAHLREQGIILPKPIIIPLPSKASKIALDYLTCWAENREGWKFQKIRQTWLLQHMFDSEQVPDEKFSVMLEYIEGLRGGARETTVQKALVLVEESGQEDPDVQKRAQRARDVIQMLA
ncbi:uncharacterized protein C7orf50 homolog [Entelurus aequoreus]|uniref:uncharacterized protein C7orf50 homolog n=1 Tax=Entelurus aequoreus TaxID=161455 RepID=UPI002B1D2C09|nr:uncharacterized protein C7orf50 homolog [Entelurus aequoreus]XP_061911922.1 uncharacterized protein C7orf50 homolog [Entelurus aequoreus]XP_061911923.1 uncharacterized protein C7orf50 homolog [Entelurus aequoreus]